LNTKLSVDTNPLEEDLHHVLTHTKVLWEELRGKNIFITGGTGFFGCWFLESFAWANKELNLNASLLVLTRDGETFKKKAPHLTEHPFISFRLGDVRDLDFPQGEFDYIIHAAAAFSSNLTGKDSLEVFDIIVEGTRHTLEFGKQCQVKKFLLISSGAVYGKQPPEMNNISEDYLGALDHTDWHSAYAEGKRSAELFAILNAGQYGFEVKIARCFAFVGPYQTLNGHWAIGNFIRDGFNGGPIVVKGDGTAFRSYLYAADLIVFLWTILFKGKSGLPYNVGSDSAINIRSLAELVNSVFKIKKDVVISGNPLSITNIDRYVPSIKRVQDELDLKQKIDLREAITRTIRYIKYKESAQYE
jgi:nucleoside-diphosphate-sugar epimerase